MSAQDQKIVQRIPLPWAVTLTVIFSLPFGLLLGNFNFTLWVCFIVWAQYFMLGAKPFTWKIVFPSFAVGAATAALWMATSNLVNGALGSHPLVGTHHRHCDLGDGLALLDATFQNVDHWHAVCVQRPRHVPGCLLHGQRAQVGD